MRIFAADIADLIIFIRAVLGGSLQRDDLFLRGIIGVQQAVAGAQHVGMRAAADENRAGFPIGQTRFQRMKLGQFRVLKLGDAFAARLFPEMVNRAVNHVQHQRFPRFRRKNRKGHGDRRTGSLRLLRAHGFLIKKFPVLRLLRFRHLQIRADFQAENQDRIPLLAQPDLLLQHAVHAIADVARLVARLKINPRHAMLEGVAEQKIHERLAGKIIENALNFFFIKPARDEMRRRLLLRVAAFLRRSVNFVNRQQNIRRAA